MPLLLLLQQSDIRQKFLKEIEESRALEIVDTDVEEGVLTLIDAQSMDGAIKEAVGGGAKEPAKW